MKRIASLLAIMLFAATTVVGQSARKYYKAGEDFYDVNKFEDAINQFSNAIELKPEYYKAYIARATAYERIDRYAEAAEDYERALVFRDRDAEIHYLAGKAYYNAGNYGAALAKLNHAIDKKSNYLQAYQTRTKVYIALERYQEALDDCKKALRYKEDALNFYNLARVYESLELYDEAEDAYQKSIKKNNNMEEVQLSFAKLAFEREKYDLSMSSVNQALRVNPQSKEALILRSRIHAERMNIMQAVNDISEALIIYRGDPELHALRGDFYQMLSRHSDAIVDYTFAIEAGDTLAEIFYKRASSYENIRDFKSAMKDYDKLLELSAYDGNAQKLLAQANERMFEINREKNKPVVKLIEPQSHNDKTLHIPKNLDVIPLRGLVEDESDIKSLKINDFTVLPAKTEAGYEFLASINLRDSDQIIVEVSDVYDNEETAVFNLIRTETEKPKVSIIAPYASDNNTIYLDSDDPVIYVEGKIAR